MATWAGCAIRRLDTVDSTNREARRWAAEGAPHGAVVIAARQTAGRGRRGRDWASAPGAGLWFTMVLRPAIPESAYPLLPFAAALAAADACRMTTGLDVGIKWPNDLVLHGRKLAGLLLEREGDAVVMGIGINVRQRLTDFPEDLQDKACSLAMYGGNVTLEALAQALISQIEARIDHFDFLPEYIERCVTIGARVRVVAVDHTFEGTAQGLDAGGALLVADDDGEVRRVLAGDVSVRGIMGYV